MAEIINLNRARKAKLRAEQDATAAANRRAFGRTKAERQAEDAERKRRADSLEGKRIDREEEPV